MGNNINYDYSDLAPKQDYDYSDLGVRSSPENVTGLPRVAGNIEAGLAQMQHGLINTPSNLARSISGYVGRPENGGTLEQRMFRKLADVIPRQQDQDYSAMYGIPNPGTLDKLSQGAVGYIPYAIGGGPKLFGQVLSSAAQGLTQSETPFKSAAINAALAPLAYGLGKGVSGAVNIGGSVLKSIPKGINSAKTTLNDAYKAITESIDPEKTAQEGLQSLGEGKTSEQTAEDVIGKIQKSHDLMEKQKTLNYEEVHNYDIPQGGKVGDANIYENVKNPRAEIYQNPQMKSAVERNFALNNSFKMFRDDPSFRNAQNFQSDLQKVAYRIKGITSDDISHRENLLKYANNVNSDMDSFLYKVSPELRQKFEDANNFFKNEYLPYKTDKTINDVVKGRVTGTGLINKVNGVLGSDELPTILKHDPSLKDNFAYLKLGGELKAEPKSLSDNIAKLNDKSSSVVSNSVKSLKETLDDQIQKSESRKKLLKTVGLTSLASVLTGLGIKIL